MPKIKMNYRSAKNAPPIDWLWAAVLERKMVLGFDLKMMAKVAGVDYDTMRHYIRKSPWEWGDKARASICVAFGIVPTRTVQFAPPQDWGRG